MRPRLAVLALIVATSPAPVFGHAFAPVLLELRPTGEETFQVRFKQPVVRPIGAAVRPLLPETCRPASSPVVAEEDTGVVARWEVTCTGGLRGRSFGVEGLASLQAPALLRLELEQGIEIRHVLTADQPSFVIPLEESALDVALSYAGLGVEHILGGWDHLLFVLGLVLLVGGGRRLVLTITAFTGGHSITLALAVLGVVAVPQVPVEVLIAFSIFLLAVELAGRERRRLAAMAPRASWIERRPAWMAGSFGLLHGLGFAGALTEVGLPPDEIPAALFAFNVGIEAGQLAFVGGVLLGWTLVSDWLEGTRAAAWPQRLMLVPVYAIGALSAYWVIERLAGML